jgi:hypothetical protein
MASGGTRRGEHDKRGGIIERGKGLLSKRCTGVEIVAVAKDRSQGFRDRPQGGFTTNNILVDGKAFETPVNPFHHGRVGMAVGQKRAIFKARHAASVGFASNFAILAEAALCETAPAIRIIRLYGTRSTPPRPRARGDAFSKVVRLREAGEFRQILKTPPIFWAKSPVIPVGPLISERPPDRSVRAEFPHTAPTLGV